MYDRNNRQKYECKHTTTKPHTRIIITTIL